MKLYKQENNKLTTINFNDEDHRDLISKLVAEWANEFIALQQCSSEDSQLIVDAMKLKKDRIDEAIINYRNAIGDVLLECKGPEDLDAKKCEQEQSSNYLKQVTPAFLEENK